MPGFYGAISPNLENCALHSDAVNTNRWNVVVQVIGWASEVEGSIEIPFGNTSTVI